MAGGAGGARLAGGPGFWAVTRHEDVVRVLKDSSTYCTCWRSTPDACERLRNGEVELATIIDELLRRHPPVLTFRRTATQDWDPAGTRIRTGDKVVVFHASANRDERVLGRLLLSCDQETLQGFWGESRRAGKNQCIANS